MLRKLLPPIPFFLNPRTAFEARYGKAVLLTDCELGIILTALGECNVCEHDEAALAGLFPKLLCALDEDAPYERLPITKGQG